MGSLMLLDSAALYFRAFHGIPPDSMTAPDGTLNLAEGQEHAMRSPHTVVSSPDTTLSW